MLVLPVNVHQVLGEFAQQRAGHRSPVDEGPRSTFLVDHPSDEAALRMVRVLQIVLGEKCRSGRLAAEVELGADVCPPGARPDGVRVCPITQNEPEGAEQNGLARSRLAGDHCQPVAQTDFERLHQCKIPYEEVSKHGLTRDELSS